MAVGTLSVTINCLRISCTVIVDNKIFHILIAIILRLIVPEVWTKQIVQRVWSAISLPRSSR